MNFMRIVGAAILGASCAVSTGAWSQETAPAQAPNQVKSVALVSVASTAKPVHRIPSVTVIGHRTRPANPDKPMPLRLALAESMH